MGDVFTWTHAGDVTDDWFVMLFWRLPLLHPTLTGSGPGPRKALPLFHAQPAAAFGREHDIVESVVEIAVVHIGIHQHLIRHALDCHRNLRSADATRQGRSPDGRGTDSTVRSEGEHCRSTAPQAARTALTDLYLRFSLHVNPSPESAKPIDLDGYKTSLPLYRSTGTLLIASISSINDATSERKRGRGGRC